MSGKPAARTGDNHDCPMVDPATSTPHKGGPLMVGATSVLIDDKFAARMGDSATCVGTPDVIAKGALPVLMENKPAARQTDQTAHGGVITGGSGTVIIGLSGTTGDLHKAKLRCRAMKKGRTTNSVQQTYNNCGVESSRQLINEATEANVSEDALLIESIEGGDAYIRVTTEVPGGEPEIRHELFSGEGYTPSFYDGGTHTEGQMAILGRYGIGASALSPSLDADAIKLASARGQGIIASVDASHYWAGYEASTEEAWHAVNIVGIEYDDAGEVTGYVINDTGTGKCARRISSEKFEKAIRAREEVELTPFVVTDEKVW